MNSLMLPATTSATNAGESMAFTFGDPIPVLDRRELLDYLEAALVGNYYEPPVSLDGLAKTFRAAIHHSSPIYCKLNILVSCFIPHPALSRADFEAWALDDLVFANAYLERQRSRLGTTLRLKPAKAKYVRRVVLIALALWTDGGLQRLISPGLSRRTPPATFMLMWQKTVS